MRTMKTIKPVLAMLGLALAFMSCSAPSVDEVLEQTEEQGVVKESSNEWYSELSKLASKGNILTDINYYAPNFGAYYNQSGTISTIDGGVKIQMSENGQWTHNIRVFFSPTGAPESVSINLGDSDKAAFSASVFRVFQVGDEVNINGDPEDPYFNFTISFRQ